MAFVLDAVRGPIGKGVLIGAGGLLIAGPLFTMGTIKISALNGQPIYQSWSPGPAEAQYVTNNVGLDYAAAVLIGCAASSWAVNRFL